MTDVSDKPRPYTREHGYNAHRSGWSDEQKEFALARAKLGDTASQIVRELEREFRIYKSRNAVIGIAHRAGVSIGGANRASHAHCGKAQGQRRSRKVQSFKWGRPRSSVPLPIEPLPPAHITDIPRKSLLQLDDCECRFPVGDGPHQMFCAAERAPGSPYCAAHHRRCFDATGAPRRLLQRPMAAWGKHQNQAVKEFMDA